MLTGKCLAVRIGPDEQVGLKPCSATHTIGSAHSVAKNHIASNTRRACSRRCCDEIANGFSAELVATASCGNSGPRSQSSDHGRAELHPTQLHQAAKSSLTSGACPIV